MLHSTFLHDPTTQPTPVYLFVPPIPVEHIDGMHCVPYPLPDGLFYWSLGSDGKNVIPEEDWKKYGVPELRTSIEIGDYNPDGRQYARDHSYPELLRDDPHDVWFRAESSSLVELFGEDEPTSKALIEEQLNTEPDISISEEPNEASNEGAIDTCSRPLTRDELKEASPIDARNEITSLNVNVPRPEGPSSPRSRWSRLLGKLGFKSRRPIGQQKTKTKRRILRKLRALWKKDGV
ncbi:hypothetical protein AAF712_013151 [Marasmius tenuissimus]|uniref:Uncharacterized protein n=1 Tax=Marasmius tenuissimus TaxID=585030 RepID=A0ABR2ZEJ6_9AGAR